MHEVEADLDDETILLFRCLSRVQVLNHSHIQTQLLQQWELALSDGKRTRCPTHKIGGNGMHVTSLPRTPGSSIATCSMVSARRCALTDSCVSPISGRALVCVSVISAEQGETCWSKPLHGAAGTEKLQLVWLWLGHYNEGCQGELDDGVFGG